jgi:hypothetical protein
MKEKIIEIVAKSADILEEIAEHKHATAEAKLHNDGSYVSPMTHTKGIGYVYSLHIPEPELEPVTFDNGEVADEPEADEELDEAERSWAAYTAAMRNLDAVDVAITAAETYAAKDGTPLIRLIERLRDEPPEDLDRIHIAPHKLEAIGKSLAIIAIELIRGRVATPTSTATF